MFGMVPGLREAGVLISGKPQQLAQPMAGANVSPLRRNLPWMNFIHENPNPHMDMECSCHRSLCGKMLMQYFIQIQVFLTPTHFQERTCHRRCSSLDAATTTGGSESCLRPARAGGPRGCYGISDSNFLLSEFVVTALQGWTHSGDAKLRLGEVPAQAPAEALDGGLGASGRDPCTAILR